MVDSKQMICACICCVIICYVSAQDKTKRSADKQMEQLPTYQSGHSIAKRGTYPFWVRHRPSVWKRFNHINSIPETIDEELSAITPAEPEPNNDLASNLMDEFMWFLTLKETGMLDMCLALKRR